MSLAPLADPEAYAGQAPVYQSLFGTAIDGTDPVSYFTEGKPIEGSSDHRMEWNGATWYFSSAENLAKFAANPEAYAPQYGGYCSWAVSQGYTASTDRDAWAIVDGKLYLNYNRRVHEQWERNIPDNIAKADQNWPDVLE